jgi:putative phage-type endonuclease
MPFECVPLEQNTPEWHRWRRGGLGASDVPCLMGEDPWKSEATLTQEKFHPRIGGRTNAAMGRGIALEPLARASYCELRKVTVRPSCVQSRSHPWMRASLDGLNEDERLVVEIKCGESCYKKTAVVGRVPHYYYGQLQHILAVLQYYSIDFWCYSPGKRPIRLEVRRDDSYIRRLIEREKEFWDSIGPSVLKQMSTN